MRAEWKAFLEGSGARRRDGRVADFGRPDDDLRQAAAGDILTDLSHLGLIGVGGEDAATFLQGQLTCDVRQVNETCATLGAYLNPKGRALAVFRLSRQSSAYYLSLPRELLDPVLKRLRMFVLRAKVVLEDASDTFLRVGVSGPNAGARLAARLGAIPPEVGGVTQVNGLSVLCIHGIQPRFEILSAEIEPMKALWAELSESMIPVGASPWDLLDILAGVPAVRPETVAAFVPQMLNLQALGGISFTKGCYTGQEIVARTHYLGKLKRRMYRAHVDSDTPPRPGQALHGSGLGEEQDAGTIVAAAPSPKGATKCWPCC